MLIVYLLIQNQKDVYVVAVRCETAPVIPPTEQHIVKKWEWNRLELGRTRRKGAAPPLSTIGAPYETIDQLTLLKTHKDEPIYHVLDRLVQVYKDKKDEEEWEQSRIQATQRLQGMITKLFGDISILIEDLASSEDKLLSINREGLSELTRQEIKRFLDKKQQITPPQII